MFILQLHLLLCLVESPQLVVDLQGIFTYIEGIVLIQELVHDNTLDI
jgi:hypothetical protein